LPAGCGDGLEFVWLAIGGFSADWLVAGVMVAFAGFSGGGGGGGSL